tara:strand:+ start:86 stop:298 length:213 start_codon:yes stop_codon:yes gene_type:complete
METEFERVLTALFESEGVENSKENRDRVIMIAIRAAHFSSPTSHSEWIDLLSDALILETRRLKVMQDADI